MSFPSFLSYYEDFKQVLKKIAEESPIIKLAYDELDKFRWDEKDLVAYEERIMDLRKEEAILEYKLEEGIEKGKIEVAKNLLKAGVSVNLIAESTGLSQAEIVQLKQEVA